MSRLRRLVVSNRFFFITCRLLPHRGRLSEREFEFLARGVGERRQKYHFLLTAWVLLPDLWHADLFPALSADRLDRDGSGQSGVRRIALMREEENRACCGSRGFSTARCGR